MILHVYVVTFLFMSWIAVQSLTSSHVTGRVLIHESRNLGFHRTLPYTNMEDNTEVSSLSLGFSHVISDRNSDSTAHLKDCILRKCVCVCVHVFNTLWGPKRTKGPHKVRLEVRCLHQVGVNLSNVRWLVAKSAHFTSEEIKKILR